MSLPYPFPFWVVAEQKGNKVGRLLYRWPTLTWRTKSPPKTLSLILPFLCWKGALISEPFNRLEHWIPVKLAYFSILVKLAYFVMILTSWKHYWHNLAFYNGILLMICGHVIVWHGVLEWQFVGFLFRSEKLSSGQQTAQASKGDDGSMSNLLDAINREFPMPGQFLSLLLNVIGSRITAQLLSSLWISAIQSFPSVIWHC